MPSPPRLQYGVSFHIFNRGNNRENLFIEERNYHYFLHLYSRHISPVADTFAYCLLRNHFHFALRIKTEDQIRAAYQALDQPKILTPSRAFSNFFNAYAKGINKAYGRTGSLFQNPFKRVPIDDDRYLQRLIVYIHRNPQKHGFAADFRDWTYSSYQSFFHHDEDFRLQEAVLEIFGGLGPFIQAHNTYDSRPLEIFKQNPFDWK